GELLDDRERVVVDLDRVPEPRPALHHAVPDGDQPDGVEVRPVLGERRGHGGHRGAVVGDVDVAAVRLAVDRVRDPAAARAADALDEPDGERGAVGGVDHLVLERGGAGVDDQHALAHADASCPETACAWIAVIATVLTMSCTSAPRERSLTGRRRPCSTGPTATAPAERCTAL